MAKFKKGDKVIVIANDFPENGVKIGDVGTIAEDDSVCPLVRFSQSNTTMLESELVLLTTDIGELSDRTAVNFITIKKKEEKDMNDVMKIYEDKKKNNVLELWYERKKKELEEEREDRYKVFKEKGNDFLAKYNDLVLEVNEKLDSLVKEDNLFNEEPLLRLNTAFTGLKYELDGEAVYELFEKDRFSQFDSQIDTLNKTYEEVKAQLSLSNDLEYQLKVLKNYGIIDKKNKISE